VIFEAGLRIGFGPMPVTVDFETPGTARIVGSALAYELVDAFLKAKFISNEERFTRRFKKVLAIEAKYLCGGPA